MADTDDIRRKLEDLERALTQHKDAEVKNLERLRSVLHAHTGAVCQAIRALVRTFADRKVVILVEAEIPAQGSRARPEDVVAWIEGIGVLVAEVKSIAIEQIRRFENNVPVVVYQGHEDAEVGLLDQPRDFAYKLKAVLEREFEDSGTAVPPLYYVGWLPNVTPEDVARLPATVAPERIWLSDLLEPKELLARLPKLKSITGAGKAERTSLRVFSDIFGTTSGLRQTAVVRTAQVGSMGHLIDRRNLQLKRLTKEQEDLAFSPNLVRGPKVIRGVVGSGKTVVLANAVAETLLRSRNTASTEQLFAAPGECMPQILVLCFNRVLVPYLKRLIGECFEARKPRSDWVLPDSCVTVTNIDRYAAGLADAMHTTYHLGEPARTVAELLDAGVPEQGRYRHVFIDEGQDVDLDWYRLVQEVAADEPGIGRSIIVFYDEAQNLYGVKRPGIGGVPTWDEYLGSSPNPRGLRTIMRVGHRNTNEILSFSFNLLLGAFAEENPQMVEFAGISAFEGLSIPDDPSIDHPNAGRPCVQKIDDRQYVVNFAVGKGPIPNVHQCLAEEEMLGQLVAEVEAATNPRGNDVQPCDVLVMAPEKAQVRRLASALSERGIQTHMPARVENGRTAGGTVPRRRDLRDDGLFAPGKVTVSTIKAAKGYTAHVCHLAYVHSLDGVGLDKEARQRNRAQLHVGCTRSSLFLDVWGTSSLLMSEAEKARAAILSTR
jgi:hypothetical protein